jgi:hypothetical protein
MNIRLRRTKGKDPKVIHGQAPKIPNKIRLRYPHPRIDKVIQLESLSKFAGRHVFRNKQAADLATIERANRDGGGPLEKKPAELCMHHDFQIGSGIVLRQASQGRHEAKKIAQSTGKNHQTFSPSDSRRSVGLRQGAQLTSHRGKYTMDESFVRNLPLSLIEIHDGTSERCTVRP